MRDEFGFDHIQSVEFCVSVTTGRDAHVNYLVPVDQTVQDALKQVLRRHRCPIRQRIPIGWPMNCLKSTARKKLFARMLLHRKWQQSSPYMGKKDGK